MSHPYLFAAVLLLAAIVLTAAWFTCKEGDPWPMGRILQGGYLIVVAICIALAGCGDTINPVRYQPVEVLVTRPCFLGRTPPAEAVTLTEPVCTGSDAECVRAAKADILELQREARQYRLLFKECSK